MKVVTKMNHPYELTDMDIERVTAVLTGELDDKWISPEELESFQDYLYDVIVAKSQNVAGSMVLQ